MSIHIWIGVRTVSFIAVNIVHDSTNHPPSNKVRLLELQARGARDINGQKNARVSVILPIHTWAIVRAGHEYRRLLIDTRERAVSQIGLAPQRRLDVNLVTPRVASVASLFGEAS
jgi:hypothetical protein